MKLSQKGIDHLIESEGFRRTMYKDVKGLATIGVGHLIKDDEPHLLEKTLTDKEVRELFKQDVSIFERCVNKSLNKPVKQNEFDALVSFAFNIGCGGFQRSSILRYINDGGTDKETVKELFMNWRKPEAIASRRMKEVYVYLDANYEISHSQVKKNEPNYFA